jgi:hypothetical protein
VGVFWGCKPEPPKILSENTVGAFPAIYTIRHCFQHTFYPALTAIISQWSLVTENKCLASQVTIADFARMPEISGVPAYIPNPRNVDFLSDTGNTGTRKWWRRFRPSFCGSSSFCVDLIFRGIKPTQNDKNNNKTACCVKVAASIAKGPVPQEAALCALQEQRDR